MRFLVIGTFGPAVNTCAKEQQPVITAQEMVIQWIRQLGGHIYDKNAGRTLLKKTSQTPNCFIVVKNDTDLMRGTMSVEEQRSLALASRKPSKKNSKHATQLIHATNSSDNDSDCSTASTGGKRIRMPETARICREFAVGDMTFIRVEYILDSLKSDTILNPYSNEYRLQPGSGVRKANIKDIRPLLLKQISPPIENASSVSAIVSLKRYRKAKIRSQSKTL